MNLFLTLFLLTVTLSLHSQNGIADSYNLTVIDSCFSKVDSSIKLISIQFKNGRDKNFEKIFIDSLKTLKQIDYFLYENAMNIRPFNEAKGINISIYYESKSCMITGGIFICDPLTFETSQIITSKDINCCWTFKAGEPVLPCK